MTRWERGIAFLAPPAVIVFLLAAANQIQQSVYNVPNWGRLQKTFVLAAGLPLYYGKFSGPALTTGYGPVSALFYLPVTFLRDPDTVMPAAALMAAFFFFVPAVFFFLSAGRPAGDSKFRWMFAVLLFTLFGFFSLILYSLKNAAFNVHVDAPALGLTALATVFLSTPREKSTAALALSALAAALAVWTKLVTLPILAALPLYVGLAFGKKTLGRYLICLATAFAAVSATLVAAFGWSDLFFNTVTIFSHHPFKENGGWLLFLDKFLREEAMILPMLVPAMILAKKDGASFWKRAWVLPALAGIFLLPASYLGFAKLGGSRNNLSYTHYFLLLAAFISWGELAEDRDWGSVVKKAAVVLVAALTVGQAAYAFSDRFLLAPRQDHARDAYNYIRLHPGEAYFPTLPLVHWLAERKFYHEAVALADREIAGYSADAGHLAAYMPRGMKIIAFPEGNDYMGWLHAPGFGRRGEDPGLPGFWVYRKA